MAARRVFTDRRPLTDPATFARSRVINSKNHPGQITPPSSPSLEGGGGVSSPDPGQAKTSSEDLLTLAARSGNVVGGLVWSVTLSYALSLR